MICLRLHHPLVDIQNHSEVLKALPLEELTVEYLFLLPRSPGYGFTGWSIPQQEGPLLTSGCCPPLSVSHGLCCDCHGNPQCRLQRFTRCVLYGGLVLLLRHDGRGVFSGRHSPLQLPAHILGQPHRHMCRLRHAHVSHMLRCSSVLQLSLGC